MFIPLLVRSATPGSMAVPSHEAQGGRQKSVRTEKVVCTFSVLREEHERTIVPAQALARETLDLEQQVSAVVNAAYGLTPEEVSLMWETAPPRMPIPGAMSG
jgi:hypothetical protein